MAFFVWCENWALELHTAATEKKARLHTLVYDQSPCSLVFRQLLEQTSPRLTKTWPLMALGGLSVGAFASTDWQSKLSKAPVPPPPPPPPKPLSIERARRRAETSTLLGY